MSKEKTELLPSLSTDKLVRALCVDGASTIVQAVVARRDCTIYHLFDLANSEVIIETLGRPQYDGDLWQDQGAVSTKFKSLPLQEQIAATRYVLKAYRDIKDTEHALAWCLEWLANSVPEGTECHTFLQVFVGDEMSSPSPVQTEALLSALELLARKEGLFRRRKRATPA